jgi:hypothetical protein
MLLLLLLLLFPFKLCSTDAPYCGHFHGRPGREGQRNKGWHSFDQGWGEGVTHSFCCRCPCCCVFCCRTDAPTVGTFAAGQGGRVNATRGGTVLIKDGVRVVDARGNFSASANATTFNVLGELVQCSR